MIEINADTLQAMWFDHARDPIMELAGWNAAESRPAMSWAVLTKPFVLQVLATLFVACTISRVVFGQLAKRWALSEKAPKDTSAVANEIALCLVGVIVHSYMGLKSVCVAWQMRDMPFDVSVGNRAAIAAHPEYIGQLNAASVLGEMFLAYICYVTVMWLLGWEKGMDKGIHHVVFFFLAVLLAGEVVLHRLAVFAISMELSTVPLNLNIWTGMLKNYKIFHLLFGALFVLTFFGVRIFYYGYGLFTTLEAVGMNDIATIPISAEASYLVLFLFTGGWLLQVYWLKAIYAAVAGTMEGKKKHE